MLRLCIDSAGDSGLLVLADDEKYIGHTEVQPCRGSDRVGSYLDHFTELCQLQHIDLVEIEQVAVVAGPGRFTGLRLGMALAQGLTLFSKTSLIGLQRQDAYRSLMVAKNGLFLCESGKMQAYGGVWQDGTCASLQLISESDAKNIQAKNILSLLPQDALMRQYPAAVQIANNIDIPNISELCAALIAGILHHELSPDTRVRYN